MHDRLLDLTDRVDAAVAAAKDILPDPVVEAAATAARNVRVRLAHPEDLVVVALAGSSGSGKSSLLNAIAGEEVVLTGGIRPTTTSPAALVPRARLGEMERYLDALEVGQRAVFDEPEWLVLIDLPDFDTTGVAHREQVDRLLPRVDVMAFVLDPEKYRDAVFHREYAAPLAGRSDQVVFVLNQVDRLDEAEADLVRADLSHALVEDGIAGPKLVLTAAAPPAGPPIGIDLLLGLLRDAAPGSEAVHAKLLADLEQAARSLLQAGPGGGVDFEERWATVRSEVARLALAGDPGRAARVLAATLDEIGDAVGGRLGRSLAALAAEAPEAVLAALDRLGPRPAPRPTLLDRLLRRRPLRPQAPVEEMERLLEQGVGRRARELLRPRAEAGAALTELALALDRMGADGGSH